mmetsp:Transcript_9279/g.31006  ORF Transcript_9279/g.31006 Transcript_9279/m.31006 type:complete len:84 (+) Transcript_9279:1794-2045(+)
MTSALLMMTNSVITRPDIANLVRWKAGRHLEETLIMYPNAKNPGGEKGGLLGQSQNPRVWMKWTITVMTMTQNLEIVLIRNTM